MINLNTFNIKLLDIVIHKIVSLFYNIYTDIDNRRHEFPRQGRRHWMLATQTHQCFSSPTNIFSTKVNEKKIITRLLTRMKSRNYFMKM